MIFTIDFHIKDKENPQFINAAAPVELPPESRRYCGWYFFRGPPAFDAQVFITGHGRRK
jgi:hypothetical protein